MPRRILDYSRGMGKTYACIEESVKTGRHILVRDFNTVHFVRELAQKMGVGNKLPYVVCVDQILKGYRNGLDPDFLRDMIVDEADEILEMLLNDFGASHSMSTFTADEIKLNTGNLLDWLS